MSSGADAPVKPRQINLQRLTEMVGNAVQPAGDLVRPYSSIERIELAAAGRRE